MKVAILGFGAEGKASYRYWQQKGEDVFIVDENERIAELPEGAQTILGADALNQLTDFDLVVRTPPLRPDRIKTNGKIWSATNEFFAQCPAPIIGVTGTKGKGTTSTLISKILEAAGFKTWLVGNIGIPALEVLEEIKRQAGSARTSSLIPHNSDNNAVVVFELSSFQLWDLEKSPETAVVLMIEPDHMDVHASMEEYIAAKANICRSQTPEDRVIYHPTNQYSQQIAETSAGTKVRYMTKEGAEVQNDAVVIAGQTICQTSEVGLLGPHNLENICAAVTAAWGYTQDIAAIKAGIVGFKGLPHRLEFAGEVDGIKFYDDSYATGAGSTLAAVRAFNKPTVLILGGSDKGVDVSPVIDKLDPAKHSLILVGQASDKLETLLKKRSFNNYVKLGPSTTMPEIVAEAKKLSASGGIVLLSPAHASFGMFKDYQDRGDQFKAAVKVL